MIIQEMQSYYGARAAEYDNSMGYNDPEIVSKLRPVIDQLRDIAAGHRVLELACGPCFWTQHVADEVETIKATDFNETTLAQARKKSLPWERVSLEQADAYHLDAILGDFDMIMAVDWFAHVPKSKIFQFLSGVTKRIPTGSPIVFIDQLPGLHSLSDCFDSEGNHIQQRYLGQERQFRVIKHFFSDEELHEWFDPHTFELSITRFPECRRVLVHGRTQTCQRMP